MKKLICLVLAVMLALFAVSAFAAEYTDKDTVKKVQQALNDAGYDCGTPDGIAGKKTYAAITSYQTDKGLTVTSIIDDELLISLGLAEAKADEAETGEVEETAEANEGYTFQEIPWDSPPEKVKSILVDTGLIDANSFSLVEGRTIYYPENEKSSDFLNLVILGNTVKDIGGYSEIRQGIKMTIADHEVSRMKFAFLYDVGDNSIKTTLGLSMVVIEYDYYDETIFEDITTKLYDSYGTYEEFKCEGSIPVRIWRGANDTVICLVNNYGYNSLIYAKADANKQVQQLEAIYEATMCP